MLDVVRDDAFLLSMRKSIEPQRVAELDRRLHAGVGDLVLEAKLLGLLAPTGIIVDSLLPVCAFVLQKALHASLDCGIVFLQDEGRQGQWRRLFHTSDSFHDVLSGLHGRAGAQSSVPELHADAPRAFAGLS